MASLIRTDTASTQNVTSELLVATYANDTGAGRDVAPQVRASNLTNTAATLRVRVAHLTAADAVLAPARVNTYWSKTTATDTVWSPQVSLSSVYLANGEKLAVYVTSTNTSDTAATIVVDWLDVSAPSVAAIAAAVWGAATSALTSAGSVGKRLVEFLGLGNYAAAPSAGDVAAEVERDAGLLAFAAAVAAGALSAQGEWLYTADGKWRVRWTDGGREVEAVEEE